MVTRKSPFKPVKASSKEDSGNLSEVGLTDQQRKVYLYLKERFYGSGSMPTLRELCRVMGWSAVGSAQTVIEALLQKGFLERDKLKARGLKLAESIDFRSVPILGAAPAGTAMESIESHQGDAIVPSFIRGPVFAVRVQGDSMVNVGIEDGDLAIVRQTPDAQTDEIVVAMISGEVTIKRFVQKSKANIWLYPENPKYKPRRIEDVSFRILGKVIGLHRYWEA